MGTKSLRGTKKQHSISQFTSQFISQLAQDVRTSFSRFQDAQDDVVRKNQEKHRPSVNAENSEEATNAYVNDGVSRRPRKSASFLFNKGQGPKGRRESGNESSQHQRKKSMVFGVVDGKLRCVPVEDANFPSAPIDDVNSPTPNDATCEERRECAPHRESVVVARSHSSPRKKSMTFGVVDGKLRCIPVSEEHSTDQVPPNMPDEGRGSIVYTHRGTAKRVSMRSHDLTHRLGASMLMRCLENLRRSIKRGSVLSISSAFFKWCRMYVVAGSKQKTLHMGLLMLHRLQSHFLVLQVSKAFHHWHHVLMYENPNSASDSSVQTNPTLLPAHKSDQQVPKRSPGASFNRINRSSSFKTYTKETFASQQQKMSRCSSMRQPSMREGARTSGIIPEKRTMHQRTLSEQIKTRPKAGVSTLNTNKSTLTHQREKRISPWDSREKNSRYVQKPKARRSVSLKARTSTRNMSTSSQQSTNSVSSSSRGSIITKKHGRVPSDQSELVNVLSLSQNSEDDFFLELEQNEDGWIPQQSRERFWQMIKHFALGQKQPQLETDYQNLTVAVRVRPLSTHEKVRRARCIVDVSENEICIEKKAPKSAAGPDMVRFAFDYCFDSQYSCENPATQQNVFDKLGVDLLRNAWMGFNATLLAYGQTGSGKTHSIIGSEGQPGLIMRLADHLFDSIGQAERESGGVNKYHVEVSCLEIYNERLRDLGYFPEKAVLKVREAPGVGVFVDGLSSRVLSSVEEMNASIADAIKSRVIGATAMNALSSRSHLIFTITFSQKFVMTNSQQMIERVSRISLTDLAGSERTGKSKVKGEEFKEGVQINKSLSTLGRVINILAKAENGPDHVPFRDSLLTWLLRESLGGNSKTSMLACLSPSHSNIDESLSTLRYANSAKLIKTRPVINEDPTARLINDLRAEIENLRHQLNLAQIPTPFTGVKVGDELFGVEGSEERLCADKLDQLVAIEAQMLHAQLSWEEGKTLEDFKMQQRADAAFVGKKRTPYLVNIHEDPLVSGRLRYFLSHGSTTIGSGGQEKVDLHFDDPGIAPIHCTFNCVSEEGFFEISVCTHTYASVIVNGEDIPQDEERILGQGDRVVLGRRLLFILIVPLLTQKDSATPSTNDFLIWQKGMFTFEQVIRELHSGCMRNGYYQPSGVLSKQDEFLNSRVSMQLEHVNEVAESLIQPVRFEIKLLRDASNSNERDSFSHTWCTSKLQYWCVWEPQTIFKDDYLQEESFNKGFPIFIIDNGDTFEELATNLSSLYQTVSKWIIQRREDPEATLFTEIFDAIQKDDKGTIGFSDLKQAFEFIGIAVPSEEILDVFQLYNCSQDGKLNCLQFIYFIEDFISTMFEACIPMPQRLQLENMRRAWAPKHRDTLRSVYNGESNAHNLFRRMGPLRKRVNSMPI